MTAETPRNPAPSLTLSSLADRLRDGPFRTLLTLHVRAGMLAGDTTADDRERIEQLGELVALARVAMTQFHDFTLELKSLIDSLSATGRPRP